MERLKYSSIILAAIVIVFFSFKKTTAEKSEIGDIRYSLLEPEVFEEMNKGWKLMAGQAMENNWDLFTLCTEKKLFDKESYAILKDNLPDARGIFLRGMEYKSSTERDMFQSEKQRMRKIGEYESDTFESHNHNQRLKYHAALNFDDNSFPPSAATHADGRSKVVEGGETGSKGGGETRPKNLAVYIYVKVSN